MSIWKRNTPTKNKKDRQRATITKMRHKIDSPYKLLQLNVILLLTLCQNLKFLMEICLIN